MVELMDRYPSVSDLEARAKRRIPYFAWEYLASGTGSDSAVRRNIAALEDVQLRPQFLKGLLKPDMSTTLFGQRYEAPFGIAPIGLTGLIWPGSDVALAEAARSHGIPYVMSTVSTGAMEETGPAAGDMALSLIHI